MKKKTTKTKRGQLTARVSVAAYDAALTFCNVRRKEAKRRAWAELPAGIPGDTESCPCARSVPGLRVTGVSWWHAGTHGVELPPEVPMPADLCDAALAFCNERRAERALGPPLSELPPGRPNDPATCPCATAAPGLEVGGLFWRWADEGYAGPLKDLPQPVRDFVEGFDSQGRAILGFDRTKSARVKRIPPTS